MTEIRADVHVSVSVSDTSARSPEPPHPSVPNSGRTPAVFAIGAVFAWLLLVMLVFVLMAVTFESIKGRGNALTMGPG